MQFGDTLSPKDVDKLKYLSACMKESQRVTPTVNGMSRILDRDIEVAGKCSTVPSQFAFQWYMQFAKLLKNTRKHVTFHHNR